MRNIQSSYAIGEQSLHTLERHTGNEGSQEEGVSREIRLDSTRQIPLDAILQYRIANGRSAVETEGGSEAIETGTSRL